MGTFSQKIQCKRSPRDGQRQRHHDRACLGSSFSSSVGGCMLDGAIGRFSCSSRDGSCRQHHEREGRTCSRTTRRRSTGKSSSSCLRTSGRRSWGSTSRSGSRRRSLTATSCSPSRPRRPCALRTERRSSRTGRSSTRRSDSRDALDAFNHPFAYAARSPQSPTASGGSRLGPAQAAPSRQKGRGRL
jgi:hypothetical protein